MNHPNFIEKIILRLRSAEDSSGIDIDGIKRVLIIRQHNQFGDLLATTPLFRAIKEYVPHAEVNLVVSPENFYAVEKNDFISRQFIFDKKKLINTKYLLQFIGFLRQQYDLVIVPVTVAISSTSCILAAVSDARFRIGPASLEGKVNNLSGLFNIAVPLSWSSEPDSHVSQFGQNILQPLGISTGNLKANIDFDESDIAAVSDLFDKNEIADGGNLIGLHIGAGKPPNRWSVANFALLVKRLEKKSAYHFIFTGSSADSEQLSEMEELLDRPILKFLNKPIPQLAALISRCTLFITNDTGVMHVAGTTDVPQVSLFGPTNPANWAPFGANKISLKVSDNIDSITVEKVYSECIQLLGVEDA